MPATPGALRLAALLVGALANPTAQGQVEKVMPVDDAYQGPALLLFRLRMTEAVTARDVSFAVGHLGASIMNSFGGGGGRRRVVERVAPLGL